MENSDLKQWIQEAVENEHHALEILRKAPSLEQVYKIVERVGLKYLGQGSSRIVYEFSPTLALKVASNRGGRSFERGYAQNSVEVGAWEGCGKPYKDIIARVVDYHPTYFWILQEKIEKEATSLTKVYGMYLRDIENAIVYYYYKHPEKMEYSRSTKDFVMATMEDKRSVTRAKNAFSKVGSNPKFSEILKLTIDCSLAVGDVAVPSAWGILPDGRPVLVDYGANNDTMEHYYEE